MNANIRTKGGSMRSLHRREEAAGWLFVAPMLIGTTVLTLIPIVATFVLSFADWKFIAGIDALRWIGWENFEKLVDDSKFQRSLLNNFIFLLSVPIYMGISLFLAIFINNLAYLKSLFKVVFFMPYISSVVAVAVVWQVLFHPSLGPVNHLLRLIGIANPPQWIADPDYALVSLMMISVWISIGFNMIVYIAGLQAIPRDMYEAAEIDGANGWVKFTRITWPLLTPTTFFLLITGFIYSFKVFDLVAVLTKGGPIQSTTMLVWYIYEKAFVSLDIGYASAIALILFLCLFIITMLQWIGQNKWVNY
jgi:multiple sugar transport system permease protein